MIEFIALAQKCAPTVDHQTMAAVVQVESGFNPYAIGVVGGRLERQPRTEAEAIATAQALHEAGWNFSVGAAQVNRYNLAKYGLDYSTAFNPCENLRAGSKILEDCYVRASAREKQPQQALQAAFSCYYSGNFTRGFKPDVPGQSSYVQKVVQSAEVTPKPIPVVPGIQPTAPKSVAGAVARPALSTGPVLLKPSKEGTATKPTEETQAPAQAEQRSGALVF